MFLDYTVNKSILLYKTKNGQDTKFPLDGCKYKGCPRWPPSPPFPRHHSQILWCSWGGTGWGCDSGQFAGRPFVSLGPGREGGGEARQTKRNLASFTEDETNTSRQHSTGRPRLNGVAHARPRDDPDEAVRLRVVAER